MNFIKMIWGDYLQRTRSYAFLVTLAISLYVAYTFVPAPDANYTTVRIGSFIGDYNSAWIGHVTAIMTSVFLSLIGFFLINNSVKKDIETEVGMIIATTRVGNFKYLLSKMLSNFLVLLSIVSIVLVMSIVIFFLRTNGFSFEISQFVLPYLFVTIPAIFLISSVAVAAEVVLGRWPVVQYIGFFILFNVVMANVQMKRGTDLLACIDPFGVKVVTMGMENFVKTHFNEDVRVTSMGFNFGDKNDVKTFVFEGIQWKASFLVSRILWMSFGAGLVFCSSIFFHRFDVREKINVKKKTKRLMQAPDAIHAKEIKLSTLPPLSIDYGIIPFIKTELLMLFRKGPRWFWIINLGGVIGLTFAPLTVAHQIMLPILWFLQIGRLSDLATKEKTNRIHYFTYAAYQPLRRLLPSQLIAGICLVLALATPLIIRFLLTAHFIQLAGIFIGAIFIVSFAAVLGIVSGGKKLFEILFFAVTYANLNLIPYTDYVGSTWTTTMPLVLLFLLTVVCIIISWAIRGCEIRHA